MTIRNFLARWIKISSRFRTTMIVGQDEANALNFQFEIIDPVRAKTT